MENSIGKRSPSKVLLFGEYSVITGRDALVFPYHRYGGAFTLPVNGKTDVQQSTWSRQYLTGFLSYLLEIRKSGFPGPFEVDIERYARLLDEGLYFSSDVPVGYGLGSSGVLCAAFAKEFTRVTGKPGLIDVKIFLARLEAFFHGSSSGIDPLASYTATPLWIKQGIVKPLPNWLPECKPGKLFLLDTGKKRNTVNLVSDFKDDMRNAGFNDEFTTNYLPLVQSCIQYLIAGNFSLFQASFRDLSIWQLKHFSRAIPPELVPTWVTGLDSGDYYFKLAGAGGGGYMLGFAPKGIIPSSLTKNFGILSIL
jgi:mevalonate kinase